MSWLDKIKNELIIKTGDGREFKPLWMKATKEKEFNIAQFEFPDVEGSLVHRTTPKGVVFSLELYFQGEDHLDDAEEFWNASDDPRPWVMTHPYYGQIVGHPTGLKLDNEPYNVTKISGTFIETITEDNPKVSIDPKDKISNDKILMDETFAVAFASGTPPDTNDIITMQKNNTDLYGIGSKRLKLTIDAEQYFNLFNEAQTKIVSATAEPLAAMRALQNVINYPALFTANIQTRLETLVDQFELLRESIGNITGASGKRIYENNGASLISAMALTSSTPQEGDNDYGNRDDVYKVIDNVLNSYNTFLSDLDELQTETGGDLDSYIPDADSMNALNALVNFTLSNLFAIALNSRQERTLILEDDSNVVMLTHRFYGLDQQDVNIDEFMRNNNIGLNEILEVKKGRTIKYYI